MGDIRVEYNLTNHARPIMLKAYSGNLDQQEIQAALKTVRKNAIGQIKLLKTLSQHPNDTLLLTKWESMGVTAGTLKTAEKKGWVSATLKRHVRNPFLREVAPTKPFELQPDQQKAVSSIEKAVSQKKKTRSSFLRGSLDLARRKSIFNQLRMHWRWGEQL